MNAPFRILLVEDDPHTRARLTGVIEQHPQLLLAGAAEDLAAARQCVAQCGPVDAALVDLGLPDGDGADLIRELSRMQPAPNVLVISVFGDERRVVHAIEAGAAGYLLKDTSEAELAQAIIAVIRGESPISPAIARHLLKRFRVPDAPSELESPITPRETEVLKLIARGFGNSEIAELLDMSVNTVGTHTKSIYRKLSVNSRSAAVFEASQLGIIREH